MALYGISLVVGGTGMLAQATRWLAARSEKTYVVARRASAFDPLPGALAVDADWKSPAFIPTLRGALEGQSPIDVALLWLHQPDAVLPGLLSLLASARVVLVLGSLDGRPATPERTERFATVRLGSVGTGHGRRWLTDAEISAGAIAALEDGASRIIGELAPTT